ncbi:hypothetical protein [Streptomyces poriticola]|uniref:hypothetical protein n=1 Tax=Streptomyces poriticola TaxID=3120506 RepID=UPI002FCE45BB
MTAGWCSRTVRAAVFAAVCVLLAAMGHAMMSGTSVPWWALAAGAAATGGVAWRLAGRERGLLLVGSATVGAQAALHSAFSLAQAVTGPGARSGGSLGRRWLEHLLCLPPAGAGGAHGTGAGAGHVMDHGATAAGHSAHAMHSLHAAHAAPSGSSVGHLDGIGTMAHMDHGMGGMSPAGMLAAHLLAALLCGLWLAYGERAAFRILRALAGWLFAPLRPLLRQPAAPHRPRPWTGRPDSCVALRRLLLTHAITSRGPPTGVAVV